MFFFLLFFFKSNWLDWSFSLSVKSKQFKLTELELFAVLKEINKFINKRIKIWNNSKEEQDRIYRVKKLKDFKWQQVSGPLHIFWYTTCFRLGQYILELRNYYV